MNTSAVSFWHNWLSPYACWNVFFCYHTVFSTHETKYIQCNGLPRSTQLCNDILYYVLLYDNIFLWNFILLKPLSKLRVQICSCVNYVINTGLNFPYLFEVNYAFRTPLQLIFNFEEAVKIIKGDPNMLQCNKNWYRTSLQIPVTSRSTVWVCGCSLAGYCGFDSGFRWRKRIAKFGSWLCVS